jgi:uncharacterized repeat protein (TIGR04076 family)
VDVRAEVIAVRGTCNAGLEEGDTFHLQGLRVVPLGRDRACNVAFASLVMNAGRLGLRPGPLGLRAGPLYVCCPDPGTGEGGNVLFELSWEVGHEDDPG